MSASAVKRPSAPSPDPAGDEIIDRQHLSRMTLGERGLEREILGLFARQAELLLPRIRGGAPAAAAAFAHTLKGSAVGVGAWRLAHAAEAVEQAKNDELAAAVDELSVAVDEIAAEVERLLRVN
jgi:HPt (histidine-containing phosphotransfer) domain-containing protein